MGMVQKELGIGSLLSLLMFLVMLSVLPFVLLSRPPVSSAIEIWNR